MLPPTRRPSVSCCRACRIAVVLLSGLHGGCIGQVDTPVGDGAVEGALRPRPPIAPSALVATAVSLSQINLTWTDSSNNESGFVIQRSSSPLGPWTQIATTA